MGILDRDRGSGSRSQRIERGDRQLDLYIDCRVTLKRNIFGLSVENEFDSDIKEIDLVCSRIFTTFLFFSQSKTIILKFKS